jgi:hypothetical protein
MYPELPTQSVIEGLKQGYILSVAYGKYVIHITFDNGNRVSFEAPFKFGPLEDLPNLPVIKFPISESNLMRVLVCTVTHAECEEDGTLRLHFSNGDALVIYRERTFESYSLVVDEQEYSL